MTAPRTGCHPSDAKHQPYNLVRHDGTDSHGRACRRASGGRCGGDAGRAHARGHPAHAQVGDRGRRRNRRRNGRRISGCGVRPGRRPDHERPGRDREWCGRSRKAPTSHRRGNGCDGFGDDRHRGHEPRSQPRPRRPDAGPKTDLLCARTAAADHAGPEHGRPLFAGDGRRLSGHARGRRLPQVHADAHDGRRHDSPRQGPHSRGRGRGPDGHRDRAPTGRAGRGLRRASRRRRAGP